MAASPAANFIYLCHLCSTEFFTRSTLFNHLTNCHRKKSHRRRDEEKLTAPILNQTEEDLLHQVRLRRLNESNSIDVHHCSIPSTDLHQYLQIPLSNLCSHGYFSSSICSSSLDDECSNVDPTISIDNDDDLSSNLLNSNGKLIFCHEYKYSRREREDSYAQMKRAILKKHVPSNRISRSKSSSSFIFNEKHLMISIPTKISSRQRISSSTNRIYPLVFDNYFHELVQWPVNSIFDSYRDELEHFFHLIHSIGSREFQYLIVNIDHQHQLSYTTYSLINLFRQTLFESSNHLKRTYFQSFASHPVEQDLNHHESLIPPLKIRRYDHSSYEIQNRSNSSSTNSSASSGMSITQIHPSSSKDDRRRPKKFVTKLSDQQINSNHSFTCDQQDFPIETRSISDGTLRDDSSKSRQISPNGTASCDQANESGPKYQSVALNDGARIRIVNCSNDNSKTTAVRSESSNNNNNNKRFSQPLDENWTSKNGRNSTRKTSDSPIPSQSVLLTDSEISHGWLTHAVFYRCHACSHEQFFVVHSRECMNLHVSSKHANMEENFKHRLSNFLNHQGRALKIFQHYLKWQQPWSEKEIDQIFQLSNISPRNNGTL